jgi:predicted RNase H-like nuclease (RuvC/YqgF family)
MTWQPHARAFVFLVLIVVPIGGVAGCDYWPPALQSQIEQLRSEVQMAAAERARFENQVKDAVKSRDELQARADELSRINRELTTRVANLEAVIMAEREKAAKMSKPGQKASPKAAAKKPAKAPAKKKTPATAKRR